MTLDCLLVLIAGLAWIYYVATFDFHLRDVRLAARIFAAGMIALAGLCIFLHLTQHTLPFWHNQRGFGPFPNRNQTGDLFGISTLVVLGCMQDDFRRGHKRWLLWAAGVGVLIAALILDFSRAGILILVIGSAAWLVRLACRKWSGAGIAVAVSLFLMLLAGLLVFGGETIERFHLRLGSEGAVDSDYRWLIFRDAWTMIQSSPWCGDRTREFRERVRTFPRGFPRRDPLASSGKRLALGWGGDGLAGRRAPAGGGVGFR